MPLPEMIPPSAAVSPASLTSALREAGDLTSGRIVDIAFSPLSATGQSATLARIDVEYHGAPDGAPNSLAVKVNTRCAWPWATRSL